MEAFPEPHHLFLPPAKIEFAVFRSQGFPASLLLLQMTSVREVWSSNMDDELEYLRGFLLDGFKLVTFDTEFPGCLRNTGKNASPEKRFSDMRYNVNRTKLIQLGIAVCKDDGNVGGVWEFNFRDFDERCDDHAPESIRMLKKHGMNFDDLRRKGIAMDDFGYRLMEVIRPHQDLSWVTFHGLYDVGYLIKLLTKTEIPESVEDFGAMVGKVIGTVCDVKYIARFCDELQKGEIGLEKMAKRLKVHRIGTAHCAGSDSLLTKSVFKIITQRFNIPREKYEGFLYGLSFQILPILRARSVFEMMIDTFDISPELFKGFLCGLSFQIRPIDGGSDGLLTHPVFQMLRNKFDISRDLFRGYLYGLSFQILPEDAGSDSLLTQSVFEMIVNKYDISPEHLEGILYGLSFQILTVDAGSDSLLVESVFETLINKLDISPELFEGFLYGLSFQILPVDLDYCDLNDACRELQNCLENSSI